MKISRRSLLKATPALFIPCAPAIIRPARAALTVNQLRGFGAKQAAASGPGPTNIQFVGGATSSKAGATSGNTTIALNSGLTGGIANSASSGDFVIGVFGTGSLSDRTLAITDGSTGYTLIGSELYSTDGSSAATNLRVGYKFITGDTSTTFGPTGSNSDAGAMAVYVFRGVNVSNPIDVTTTTATGSGSGAANPPAITPSTEGSYIVCIGSHGSVGGAVFTSSDLTDFLTVTSGDTNDATIGIGHYTGWASGPFDAAAFGTAASSLSAWAAMSIALRTS